MKHTHIIHMLIIAAAALLAYSNTFHVPFYFDDEPNIVRNPLIQNTQYLFYPSQYCSQASPFTDERNACQFIHSRYIGYLSFALNYRLNGLDVTGYHILNLTVHILNGFLIYLFVYLTFRTPFFSGFPVRDHAQVIALFSSLFFITHPVQTQAVTYIVQRLASLAAMFYLLSAVLYIKWRLLQVKTEQRGIDTARTQKILSSKSVFFYLTSLVSAAVAMKTKEITFTLPFIIVLYEIMFFSGKVSKRFIFLIPFFCTLFIIPFSIFSIDKPLGVLVHSMSEATRLFTTVSRWDYLLTEFRVIVTYLRLLIFPVNQNLDYDYPIYHSFFDPEVFLSFLFLLSIATLAIYLLYRYRNTRPYTRLVAFGIFWFFVTISIESSIIPIVDVIFEHRLYLPSIGLFISFTTAVYGLANTYRDKWKAGEKAIVAAFICITIILSGVAYSRNQVWRNPLHLWEDVVSKSPKNARGYYNLGLVYLLNGDLLNAKREWEMTLKIQPSHSYALNQLGNIYLMSNNLIEAKKYYLKAIQVNYRNIEAHYNLAQISETLNERNEAVFHYEAFLRMLSPQYIYLLPEIKSKLIQLSIESPERTANKEQR
jgi:protein O-mannosyl-transferase